MKKIFSAFLIIFFLSAPLIAQQYQSGKSKQQTLQTEPNTIPIPTGKLILHITDTSTGKPTPARVRLLCDDGTYIRPENSLRVHDHKLPYAHFKGGADRKTGREDLFYSPAHFETEIPTGKYNILVEKGFEYNPWENDFQINTNQTTELNVRLSRWIDMPSEGWLSADPHIHFGRKEPNSSQKMLELLKAEDLKLGYLLMSISRGKVYNFQPAFGKAGSAYSDGHSIHAAEEFTNDKYSHLAFIDIPQLIEPLGTGPRRGLDTKADYPPNCDFQKQVKDLGGTVIACHGGYGEFPVDLTLGLVDAVEIMQGNKWQRYHGTSNLFAPAFYHALNCGFKLTGVSGSDYPVLGEKILGHVRSYAYVGDDLTDKAWVKGLKQGRLFVTNGPMMMDFSINGQMMGDTIKLDEPDRKVNLSVCIRSLYPLDNLQVIRNGIIIREIRNKKKLIPLEFQGQIPIRKSSWIIVRAQGRHPNPKRGHLLTHSNPIYIEVAEKPVLVPESVIWWIEKIDELIDWTNQKAIFDRQEDKKRTLEIFRKGKRYYERLLEKCNY